MPFVSTTNAKVASRDATNDLKVGHVTARAAQLEWRVVLPICG
jgi:hypothetical protein